MAVAVLGDLESADKIASVTGAVAALTGVPLALLGLRQPADAGSGTDPEAGAGAVLPAGTAETAAAGVVGGSVREVTVHSERGGIAAAGNITGTRAAAGNITGAGAGSPAAQTGNQAVPGIDKREVRATGTGSIAAGGDITGIDLSGPRP
ncbi:hypothetical protein [Kitasatospora sp. NE20-6]|uniref:hypothetical protein n=1 Tax=Kitasatospora sp. NE20-6 TaxID=2859066 RepID=UPI0038B3312F